MYLNQILSKNILINLTLFSFIHQSKDAAMGHVFIAKLPRRVIERVVALSTLKPPFINKFHHSPHLYILIYIYKYIVRHANASRKRIHTNTLLHFGFTYLSFPVERPQEHGAQCAQSRDHRFIRRTLYACGEFAIMGHSGTSYMGRYDMYVVNSILNEIIYFCNKPM